MNSNKQIKYGMILSYLTLMVGLFSQLIVTPLVISAIGSSEHGVYTLAVSIVNYLNLLSFGISSAYIKFYSVAKVSGDDNEVVCLNGSLFFVFVIISTVLFLAGTAVTCFCDRFVQNTFTPGEIVSLKKIIFILTINLSLTFMGSVHNSYIVALEKFTFQKTLALIKSIIQPVLSVVLVYVGLKSFSLAVSLVAVSQFVNFVTVLYAYKCNKFSMKIQPPSADFLKSLFGYCGYIFLAMIIDQINWNVDKLLLGTMIGATAVSVYGIGAQFNDFFKALSTSVSSMYTPMIHKLETSENKIEEINRSLTDIMIKAGRLQFLIIMLAYSGFVFLGRQFIRVWVGDVYIESYYVALLILGSEIVPLIENVAIEIRRAKNKQKVPTAVSSVIVILNLIISILLCRKYGPTGCAVGTAVSMILGNCFLNFYYAVALKLDMKLFWKNILHTAKGIVLPVACGIIICMYADINGYVKLLLYGFVYMIVYLISVYLFGLTKSEKNKVKSILHKFRFIKT